MKHALAATITAVGMFMTATVDAETRVDFELVTEPGFPLGGEREWLGMIGELPGANVRIRTGRGRERPEAKKIGNNRFQVTGILTSRSQLLLPGGQFGLGDRQRISAWMTKLGDEGSEGIAAPRDQFGLTEEQLVALHEALTQPLEFETKEMPVSEFLARVQEQTGVPVAQGPAARPAASRSATVRDELNGLSAGTAVALALRPYGLAAVPQRTAGRSQLEIVSAEAEETWPTGWPAREPPKDLVPDFFKSLNVEIHDTPVAETLAAIEGRVKVRFLYDHRAIARHSIDLTKVKASVPAGRTYYKRVFDTVLFKATLRSEIRTDEAGTPFMWITR